jgi:hypothetical protein
MSTETKTGIYRKIQQVMLAVKGVEKGDYNQHAKYKFAGHEAVTSALRTEFANLGIVRHASALSCDVLETGAVKIMVRVTYVDVDDGSRIELDMPAIQPPQGKPSAQQVGQAISYAVKTTEMKLFALTGDTEPDSDAGHEPPPQSRSDNWTHPSANPTPQNDAQQANAAAPGPITVQFIHGETAEAPDPTEAAKLLARRMRQLDSPLHIQDMMKFNDGWVSKLPETWRSGMMSILADKQKAADEMAQSMGGRAA